MDALKLDVGVRERAQDITRLEESRLQFRPYAADLPKREAEVAAQWQVASEVARSIGWPLGSEDTLRTKLPSPLVRAELARLVQEQPVLQGKLDAAENAETAKREELEQARVDLGQLTTSAAPIELQTALQRAQQLGDFEARARDLRQTRTRRSTSQESAFAALGKWRQDEAGLRSMTPPSPKAIQALIQEQIADEAALKAAKLRVHKQQQQIALQELDINQYQFRRQLFCQFLGGRIEAIQIGAHGVNSLRANALHCGQRGLDILGRFQDGLDVSQRSVDGQLGLR